MYRNKEFLRPGDYLALLAIAIVFVPLSLVYELNQVYSGDQLQMALKGFHAYFNDEYLPFGNEASSMGNVPGMLSSWLIGFPLKIYAGIESVIALQLIIRLLAVFIFANALAQIFGRVIVVLGTFLFALSPWYMYMTMLYNPAYIHFGSAIVFNALVRLRVERNNPVSSGGGRIMSSMFVILGIGFILQLHYSWTVIAAICFFMWLRRDIKVSYTGLTLGFAIFGASMVPYVQEIMVNPTLLSPRDDYAVDRYIGYGFTHVYPILKGILYWLRFGSLMVTNKAITTNEQFGEPDGIWEFLSWGWIGIASVIGVASVLFSAYGNYFVITRFRSSASSERLHFVRGMTISCLFAVIVAAGASPVVLNFWQISAIMPFALMPVLAFISVRHQYIRTYTITAILFFAAANSIAAVNSDKFHYSYRPVQGFYEDCLRGFGKDKCEPFAAHLTAADQAESQSRHPELDHESINRVIKGQIPLPPRLAAQKAEEERAAREKAAAEGAAAAPAAADDAAAGAEPSSDEAAKASEDGKAGAAEGNAGASDAAAKNKDDKAALKEKAGVDSKAMAEAEAKIKAAEADAKAKAKAHAEAKAAEAKARAEAEKKAAADARAKAEAERKAQESEPEVKDKPEDGANSAWGEIVIDTSDAESGELILR